METLEFNNGYKRYKINGMNGPCEICIHPTDYGIAKRIEEAMAVLNKTREELDYDNNRFDIETLAAFDRIAREQIDAVFGDGISAKVFGKAYCSSSVNGQPCFCGFLELMTGVIEEALKREAEMSKQKIAKYTSQVNDAK